MIEQFAELYSSHITRQGADKLLEWLEKETDFFTAPASTKFHLSCKHGLVRHSINVFNRLQTLANNCYIESHAICGLLHDVCKANFYKSDFRNVKNENGYWERVPYYTVEDKFPYGHGEKSVYLIQKFMPLSDDESMAIRWHMGSFEEGKASMVSQAFTQYPLAVRLHIADLESTFLDEVNDGNKV